MSNIYEALKRAREEREGSAGSGPTARSPREQTKDEGLVKLQEIFIEKSKDSVEPRKPTLLEVRGHRAIDDRLVAFTDPQSVPAEQFRKIRTVLSEFRIAKGCRSVMITSTLPGEGKTLTACNLGVTITQGLDDKAFLIDCDVRKPGVHHVFGLEGRPGLAEFLSGEKGLSQVVQEVEGLRLKVIPAGRGSDGPAELLSSNKMADFLENLREKCPDHYIILDATPVLSAAETGALARMVDGIILMILAEHTSRDLVKRALKEIGKDKVIGLVANYGRSRAGYYSEQYHGYSYSVRSARTRKK
ncbi:MAG: polysaccharide biosynthesis tyrosine autokinase [candidate division Zixibacteria bacterium]|nr:polysaccharide biosynthesis tyrosine autokinase [candidate division Zixibacteria bacterium]